MASYKGAAISESALGIIVILLAIAVLAVVYLLLTGFFSSYVGKNINSDVKLCESFQKVPLFGTMASCPA